MTHLSVPVSHLTSAVSTGFNSTIVPQTQTDDTNRTLALESCSFVASKVLFFALRATDVR